jgi:hypothetical protein
VALEDFLDSTCDILIERTGVKDSVGGTTRTPYQTVQTNIPCLLQETGGAGDDPDEDREAEVNTIFVHFNADYGLTASNVLKVGSRYLHVQGTQDYNSLGEHVVATCFELIG